MKFHSTVLFVKDIQIAKDFYTRVLGMQIEHDFGNNMILEGGISLWEVQKEHSIARNLQTDDRSNRFELYFETADVENVEKKLMEENTDFLHKLREEPWGQRTLRFFDPDHHLLEIGEPLEVFVHNMSKRGLSEQQIADKSGIPVETVNQLLASNG